jgi:hypothetical protein
MLLSRCNLGGWVSDHSKYNFSVSRQRFGVQEILLVPLLESDDQLDNPLKICINLQKLIAHKELEEAAFVKWRLSCDYLNHMSPILLRGIESKLLSQRLLFKMTYTYSVYAIHP